MIIRRTDEKQLTAFLTEVSMTISLFDEVRGAEFDETTPNQNRNYATETKRQQRLLEYVHRADGIRTRFVIFFAPTLARYDE